MEKFCPVQLLCADGVERLGAECAVWFVPYRTSDIVRILTRSHREALDHSVTIPDRSVNNTPVGSIRTIASHQSSALSATSVSSNGSRLVFLL